MWSITQRKTPVEVIKTIWNILISSPCEELDHAKLLKQLSKTLPSCTQEIGEGHITTALREHLIVECKKAKPRSKQKPATFYSLPKWEEFAFFEEQADFWCYECHAAGEILKCEGCLRSFHRQCIKTLEEKQLELEQFVPKQKRITISSFGTTATVPRRQSTVSPVATEESNVRNRNASVAEMLVPPFIDNSVSSSEMQEDEILIMSEETSVNSANAATVKSEICSEENVKQENDVEQTIAMNDEEPQFVCVVRPPNRRLEERLNTPSIKPEDNPASQQDDIREMEKRFCYACRLLKNSSNNVPPHVGKQELNYLLKFVLEQYKSWLPEDTFSTTKLGNGKASQRSALDRKTIEVCKIMLIRRQKSIADIHKKIENERYNTLDEFHVDLLDVAHNIAVIHGVHSLEYDAMMYFLADCVYDLFEIRQCPDCYRHSNEKTGPDFFARPCRTRHELVYAKQKSYQYWPAKVIRVVNNKYDVRFFGDKHLRALVDASSVKPIDTEPRSLKINLKHRGFQLATDELLKHQALLDGPREPYAFGSAHVSTALNIPDTTTTGAMLGYDPPFSMVVGVAHRMKRGKQAQPDTTQQHISPNEQSQIHHNFDMEPNRATTKERVVRRRESLPRHQDAKKPRNNDTTSASSRTTAGSIRNTSKQTVQDAPVATQQNNNTLSSNYNSCSVGTSSANSTRLPRTKQNLKQMFAELSDPNRFKNIIDQTNDPEQIKQIAMKALQESEDRCNRKIDWLKTSHQRNVSEIKKKQWCATCEMESNLPCCWNTSYCSAICQAKHWPVHKKRHHRIPRALL